MQLHQIKPIHKLKNKKPRVGRGGKRGTYSGRGQKGQKVHAGRTIHPAVYDLLIKIPKLKGFKNKPTSDKPLILNINNLNKIKEENINPQTLIKNGLINSGRLRKNKSGIKLLGNGVINRKITISGISVSSSAKEKIEKAGGQIK